MKPGPKPTRLWHRFCRKHYEWLINERIYARCPPKKITKDPCKDKPCPPNNMRSKIEQIKLVGATMALGTAAFYSFGQLDTKKYCGLFAPYDCSIEVLKKKELEKKIYKKIPCDERVPPEIPPCICDEDEEDAKNREREKEREKKKKKKKKSSCI